MMTKNIRNEFKACGLFPFDPNAADHSKCLQMKPEQKTQDLTYSDVKNAIKL